MPLYNFNKIEDNIYLGDIMTAQNREFLQQFKIKRILSVVDIPIDDSNRNEGIIYKQIKVEDKEQEDIISYFPECTDFILDAQKNCENVFIHCREGLTVSPIFVTAFLMKKYGFLAENTIEKMVKLRAGTTFNAGFDQQSRLWEKMSYKLDGSDREYRKLLFENLKYELRNVVENQIGLKGYNNVFEIYANKIFAAETNIQTSDLGIAYRCLKCNNKLFYAINVFENQCEPTLLCKYIYIDPQSIIAEDIKKATEEVQSISELLKGVIECGQCKRNIGFFDWSRQKVCECHRHKDLQFYSNITIYTESVLYFI